jgi:hypothetical protein
MSKETAYHSNCTVGQFFAYNDLHTHTHSTAQHSTAYHLPTATRNFFPFLRSVFSALEPKNDKLRTHCVLNTGFVAAAAAITLADCVLVVHGMELRRHATVVEATELNDRTIVEVLHTLYDIVRERGAEKRLMTRESIMFIERDKKKKKRLKKGKGQKEKMRKK